MLTEYVRTQMSNLNVKNKQTFSKEDIKMDKNFRENSPTEFTREMYTKTIAKYHFSFSLECL